MKSSLFDRAAPGQFVDIRVMGRLPTPADMGGAPQPAAAARRHKLWELGKHLHCPIIGTCFTTTTLRRLFARSEYECPEVDEDTGYTLHTLVVSLAQARNGLSESLQKELERQYGQEARAWLQIKDRKQLMQRWREAMRSGKVEAALWAVATHPLADAFVQDEISKDVHMLSHQVGASQRADLARLAQAEELARQQARQLVELGATLEARSEECERLRQELVEARQALAVQREREQRLQAAVQALEAGEGLRLLQQENARLQEELTHSQTRRRALQQQVRESRRAAPLPAMPAAPAVLPTQDCPVDAAPPDLAGKCVLCVGGLTRNCEQYRQAVESLNGRFAHHDGGIEDNAHRLPPLLASADVVVCHASHVKHSAYYVVKNYCKKIGKPCLLIEGSSTGALLNALRRPGISA